MTFGVTNLLIYYMAKLNFKRFGEGEPLIILHGLYGSSDNWVSVARELMTHFSVYVLDLRNHGASPHLPEHNYEVMTDDLLEFMNDTGMYSAIFLGHSMGGKLAMYFTATYPERIKKLIVVDISPRSYEFKKGDTQTSEHLEILGALASVNLQLITSRDEANQMLSTKIHSDRIRQFLLKNLKRNKDSSFQWKININALQKNLSSILVGLEQEKDNLKLFENAVLFIKGADSNYIKQNDERLINELFTMVKIETIENSGHWVHAEQPELFISIVKQFIYN
jgi:pimeloyl-ACP methyl ester carboxylesterase